MAFVVTNASWQMLYPHATHSFVTILSARTTALGVSYLKIFFANGNPFGHIDPYHMIYYAYKRGLGVNTKQSELNRELAFSYQMNAVGHATRFHAGGWLNGATV